MGITYVDYGGLRIPVMESKRANPLYNLPQDEIDKLRNGGLFDQNRSHCYASVPFSARHEYLDDEQIKKRIGFAQYNKATLAHQMVDAKVPCKQQNGHGFCWMYGCVSAVECSRLAQGLPYVELNPHTSAAGRTGGRDRGGFSDEGFEWLASNGVIPASAYDGRNLRECLKLWDDPAMVTEAAKYKALEFEEIEAGDMRALRTLLADNKGVAIGLSWWGHMIVCLGLMLDDSLGWLYLIRNSHGPQFGNDGFCFLTESVAKHMGGAVALVAE